MVFISVFISRFIVLSEEGTQRGAPRRTREGLIMGGGNTVRAAPPARPTDPATRVPSLDIRKTEHYFEDKKSNLDQGFCEVLDVHDAGHTRNAAGPHRYKINTCFAKSDSDLAPNWKS